MEAASTCAPMASVVRRKDALVDRMSDTTDPSTGADGCDQFVDDGSD